jgi:8-oxo-dGTP pyrophosphatase MutT (NUDIX family)
MADVTRAATIIVARVLPDDAFEVFLVKRHGRSGFMAGAHVFPGGKLDPEDEDNDADAGDVGTGERGFRCCAIRETFEETGVLFARPESGLPLSTQSAIQAVSARVAGGASFFDALAGAGLVVDVDALLPVAWWITPEVEPRRFDTRFYFAVVPPLQRHSAVADGVEVEDGVWLTPQRALEAVSAQQMRVAPPTLVLLEELASLPLSAVRAHPWPLAPVCPVLCPVDDGMVLALPGDPLHPVGEGLWPHRTRVVIGEGGRFWSGRAP